MSLSQVDRKKLMIAAGVVVVALVVLLFVVRGGKRGRRQGGPAGAFAPAGETAAGTGTEAAPAPGTAGRQAPAAGAPAAGAPTEVAAAAPNMLGPIRAGRGSEVRTRSDPFWTFVPPPIPTPPELVVNPPPVSLSAGGIRPVPLGAIEVAAGSEIGRNRVAGLMFNEGAYAILDQGQGQTFVVKPGDIVQGNRITAIARDSIYLVDSEGKRWQVQLRGLGPGGASLSAPSATTEGMPESPPEEF